MGWRPCIPCLKSIRRIGIDVRYLLRLSCSRRCRGGTYVVPVGSQEIRWDSFTSLRGRLRLPRIVARDAVPAGRGIFCLFFCLCSDPPQVPPDWKKGEVLLTSGKYRNAVPQYCPATMRMRRGKEEPGRHQRSISEGRKTSKEMFDKAAEAKPWRGRGGIVLLRRRGEARGEGTPQRVHSSNQHRRLQR